MNATPEQFLEQRAPSLIIRRTLTDVSDFSYYARLSANPDPARFLVLVHGIARQADFMLRMFAEAADRHNFSLIAPLFSYRSYPDYQRLGRAGLGERADLAFLSMVEDVQSRLGMGPQFDVLGFSGGAQFAHRLAYACPDVARSLVLAAAGWYTPPDQSGRFPYGLKRTRRLPGVKFRGRGVIDTPTLTVVGDRDTQRDGALRQTDRVDTKQGLNRVARAKWFHDQLREAARVRARGVEHEFRMLPDTGHSVATAVQRGGLDELTLEFCERQIIGISTETDQ